MGKTASGAVWLNADRVSPYDYWQFWRNTEDADVGRFLRLFTELPLTEVARLESLAGADINAAKAVLATEATRLCHGNDAAEQAARTAQDAFAGGAAEGLRTYTLSQPTPIGDVMVGLGLASSKSDARRLVEQGGVKLNDQLVRSPAVTIADSDLDAEGVARLTVGKKRHGLIRRA
jgi:tyrosyl-tRNA synthetase